MVELMVALALGLLLTAGILQVFVGSKETFEFQRELARIQENGRFAMEFLTRDIRQADYWGCHSDGTKVQSILNGAGSVDVYAAGITGLDGVAAASTGYTSYLGGANQPDAIILQGARDAGVPVHKIPAATAANVQIYNTPLSDEIEKGDIVLITDCKEARIFQVSGINSSTEPDAIPLGHNTGNIIVNGSAVGPGNSTNDFGYPFSSDAFIYSGASQVRYWIREGTSGEPALVRAEENDSGWNDWENGGDELVDGVENMQLLYGVDTSNNGAPNYFAPADAVPDMDKVVSVQIHLAIRSLRENLVEPRQIEYYGGPKSTNDTRIHKVFTTTVALRNRLD